MRIVRVLTFLLSLFCVTGAAAQDVTLPLMCFPSAPTIKSMEEFAESKQTTLQVLDGEHAKTFLTELGFSERAPSFWSRVLYIVFPDGHLEFGLQRSGGPQVCVSSSFGASPDQAREVMLKVKGQGI